MLDMHKHDATRHASIRTHITCAYMHRINAVCVSECVVVWCVVFVPNINPMSGPVWADREIIA